MTTADSTDMSPADLEEALDRLEHQLGHDQIESIQAFETEEDYAGAMHMGLGRGVRNIWGLWGDSRLARYFQGLGIEHPDDMSGIILKSLWRKVNGKAIDLSDQLTVYTRWQRLMTEPQDTVFSGCPGGAVVIGGQGVEADNELDRFIWIGRCLADDVIWMHENDRGWYRADSVTTAKWTFRFGPPEIVEP